MARSNRSIVEVTFIDGEMKNYVISASPTISQYLAREAAQTGILTLFNEDEAHGIPLTQIREYVLRPAAEPDEGES